MKAKAILVLTALLSALIHILHGPAILLALRRNLELIHTTDLELKLLCATKIPDLVIAPWQRTHHAGPKGRVRLFCRHGADLLVPVVKNVWLRICRVYEGTSASRRVECQAVTLIAVLVAIGFAFGQGFGGGEPDVGTPWSVIAVEGVVSTIDRANLTFVSGADGGGAAG